MRQCVLSGFWPPARKKATKERGEDMDYWRGRPNGKHICMYFYKRSLPSLWPMWVSPVLQRTKTDASSRGNALLPWVIGLMRSQVPESEPPFHMPLNSRLHVVFLCRVVRAFSENMHHISLWMISMKGIYFVSSTEPGTLPKTNLNDLWFPQVPTR